MRAYFLILPLVSTWAVSACSDDDDATEPEPSGGSGGAGGSTAAGAAAGSAGAAGSGGAPRGGSGGSGDAGSSSGGTAPAPDGAPSPSDDATPPELRNVRVELSGDLGVSFDLNRLDATHALPVATTAEFTVFARDDETPTEELVAEVVDAEGVPVDGQTAVFEGGLWRITVAVARGQTLSVRVRDAAGNEIASQALVLPAAAEALQGAWETPFFDVDQSPTERWALSFDPNGWTETRQAGSFTHAGRFAVAGDTLTFSETSSSGGAADDADTTTVEWERVAAFYLDDGFFSDRPYQRTAGTTGIAGTWERSYQLSMVSGGTLQVAEDVTETLTFNSDDTWSETRTGIGASPQSQSGTFRTEAAESYTTSITAFVARTVTTVDGAPVTPGAESFASYDIRGSFLLVDPYRR